MYLVIVPMKRKYEPLDLIAGALDSQILNKRPKLAVHQRLIPIQKVQIYAAEMHANQADGASR